MTKHTTATAAATLSLSFALCFAAFTTAYAQDKQLSPLQKENARFSDELEAATKKITVAHVVKLKELQKKAMADGDLDGALVIREEVKRVNEGDNKKGKEGNVKTSEAKGDLPKVAVKEGPTQLTVHDLEKKLIGTKWRWGYGDETITFLPNGKAKNSVHPEGLTWSITDAKEPTIRGRLLYNEKSNYMIKLNDGITSGEKGEGDSFSDYKATITVVGNGK